MSQAHTHHITPLKIYIGVATALLLFTAITVWVAQLDFGEWNMVVAMFVAALKATLVALFFMHLFYDNKIYMIIFISSLLFLAIFIIFTMYDTERRDSVHLQASSPIQAEAIIYRPQPGAAGAGGPADSASTGEKTDTTGAVDASEDQEDSEDWEFE